MLSAPGGPLLGLDLGGTNIKGVVVAADRILAQHQVPTPGGGQVEVTAALVGLGRSLLAGRPPAAVGVAVPGVVDMAGGRVLFLPNVAGDWEGHPLTAVLEGALGCPCALLNDGRAATFGEFQLGAGRGCRHLALVAVGTGIGGGIVVDGRLVLGGAGHAGEVGHQLLDPSGPLCGCGQRGCAEALASGRALRVAAARALAEGRVSALGDGPGGLDALTPRRVAEAALQGDRLASELLAAQARCLGLLVANLVLLCNPERVVVGGGVALAGAPLLDGIRETLAARCGWYLRHAPVEVVPAALGPLAGALGAAAWAAARPRTAT